MNTTAQQTAAWTQRITAPTTYKYGTEQTYIHTYIHTHILETYILNIHTYFPANQEAPRIFGAFLAFLGGWDQPAHRGSLAPFWGEALARIRNGKGNAPVGSTGEEGRET
jgi:hypothetical protein